MISNQEIPLDSLLRRKPKNIISKKLSKVFSTFKKQKYKHKKKSNSPIEMEVR